MTKKNEETAFMLLGPALLIVTMLSDIYGSMLFIGMVAIAVVLRLTDPPPREASPPPVCITKGPYR